MAFTAAPTKPQRSIEASIKRLSNNAGEAYDLFLNDLDSYVNEITVAVTDAPADQVLGMQGRAQQARKFQRMFHEAKT